MKNLGRVTLFVMLFAHALYGGVVASVSSKSIELGETVTYSLDISGENIQRPSIHSLCGSDILSTSASTSIQSVNGMYKKSYILSYKFLPQKSCEVEALEIVIDGKTEKTPAVQIEVRPVAHAKDADIVLSLESDKKELFVGEPFELTLLFKQKRNIEAVDSKFSAPDLKGFWVKSESKPERYEEGEYTITKVLYTMAPQREGVLKIASAQMAIASRSSSNDAWGTWVPTIAWKSYFSNEVDLTVKPLPAGVTLVGDFTISATVEKSEINANEAVNVLVEVLGDGNLEDIKTFKPSVERVTAFDEKIVIQGQKLSQKMAFVADEDFVIPSFSLHYFDTKTQEIKSVATQEIPIKVKNAKPKAELKIQREQSQTPVPQASGDEINIYWVILGFLAGLACGVVCMLFKPWRFITDKKAVSLSEPKQLLCKLLPHKEDAEVQNLINILEKNIYSGEDIKIDKKVLKEVLKNIH